MRRLVVLGHFDIEVGYSNQIIENHSPPLHLIKKKTLLMVKANEANWTFGLSVIKVLLQSPFDLM